MSFRASTPVSPSTPVARPPTPNWTERDQRLGTPKHAAAARDLGDSIGPSPESPALRQSLTEVQYSRWLVAETKRRMGVEERGNNDEIRQARHNQIDAHVRYARASAVDKKEQMQTVKKNVEMVRQRNAETAAELRAQLENLMMEGAGNRKAWADRGRSLVEQSKGVQAAHVRLEQEQLRSQKASQGQLSKREREVRHTELMKKRDASSNGNRELYERIREETSQQVHNAAKKDVVATNFAQGENTRKDEVEWKSARAADDFAFLQRQQLRRKAISDTKHGARSARQGLLDDRRRAATALPEAQKEIRSRRQAELQRSHQQARQTHDSLYYSKFTTDDKAAEMAPALAQRALAGEESADADQNEHDWALWR